MLNPTSASITVNTDIKNNINTTILNNIFGSECVELISMIQTLLLSSIDEVNAHEFEMRFGNESVHTSKKQWNNFLHRFSDILTPTAYFNDVIINHSWQQDFQNNPPEAQFTGISAQ